ncbi:MAG TPA: flagellar hook-associated protein FlgL [Lacisediminihabitans sp.]|nr:flagellar hook-associated protein FlgL [Lacisediminihabitans sp.]HXD62157.1 flagellar hook-associated protein FlgL [Lacisediminihabitans sp.]
MFSRVTNQSLTRNAQYNLQTGLSSLAKLQNQAASRKAISVPSDDPAGTTKALQVRSEKAATAQYARNIDDGNAWLGTIDSTMTTVSNILGRIRDLTVQGANDGAMSPTSKQAISTELTNLKGELLRQANTSYLGRNVFAGNTDAGVAFNPDYSFNGATGSTVQRRIDASTTVRVDADGAAVFGVNPGADPVLNPGTTPGSVFTLVDNIISDLQSGVNVGARLAEIDQRKQAISAQQAIIGTTEAQMDRAQATNASQTVSLEAQRSSVEDLDLGKVILDLQTQQTTYQASLGVTARVLQPTLMDFLR